MLLFVLMYISFVFVCVAACDGPLGHHVLDGSGDGLAHPPSGDINNTICYLRGGNAVHATATIDAESGTKQVRLDVGEQAGGVVVSHQWITSDGARPGKAMAGQEGEPHDHAPASNFTHRSPSQFLTVSDLTFFCIYFPHGLYR